MSDIAKYIIGGVVAIIVLAIVLHFVNKSFYLKYGHSLYGGGLAMLVIIAGALGAFLLSDNKSLALICGAVSIIMFVILLIVNIKWFGVGVGIGAIFLQIIFSVPSLLLILELFTNKGCSTTLNSMHRSRRRMDKNRQNNRNNYY